MASICRPNGRGVPPKTPAPLNLRVVRRTVFPPRKPGVGARKLEFGGGVGVSDQLRTGDVGVDRWLAHARPGDLAELADIRQRRKENDIERAVLAQRYRRLHDKLAKRGRAALQQQATAPEREARA